MAGKRNRELRRRAAARQPKTKFYLYCEGRNTEPHYFYALAKKHGGALIEVDINPGVGVPATIASAAIKKANEIGLGKRKKRKRESYEINDEVWAIFDRDEHPMFDESVRSCEASSVGVATSNPCFEVWLILHIEDYHRPDDRHEAQRYLEGICPDYDRNGGKTLNCLNLIEAVELAEERARTQLNRRAEEGDPYGPPSTTVGCLCASIRKAAARS